MLEEFETANRSERGTEALRARGLRSVAADLGLDSSGSIEDLEDRIRELPITAKVDVMDHPERFRRNVDVATSTLSTGGSTGSPLKFPVTRDAVHRQWAVWWRYRRWHGIGLGTWSAQFGGRRVVPPSETSRFWRRNVPERQLQLSTQHLSASTVHRYVDVLDRQGVPWIHGLPSTITRLASLMDDAGLRLARPIRWVTFGSENEPNGCRPLVREVFGVEPRQHYGLAEAAANLSECPHGRLHVDEDFAFVEFIPQGDGTLHRVVGTALWNPAFRFVRYDTGDLVSGLSDGCDCGRPGRTVARIDGRTASYAELPDGRRVGPVSHLFRGLDGIVAGQVFVEPEGRIVIHLVPGRSYDSATADELDRRTATAAGGPVSVVVEERDELLRGPNGKVPIVVQGSPPPLPRSAATTPISTTTLPRSPGAPILLDFSLVAPGGAANHAHGFLSALAVGSGPVDDLVVALPGDRSVLVAEERSLASAGVATVRIGSSKAAGSWSSRLSGQIALPRLARTLRPRVVFLPREVGPVLLRRPSVLMAANVLRWGHRAPSSEWKVRVLAELKSAVARRAVTSAVAMVAPTRTVADLLPKGVDVTVIPLGVDMDAIDPDPIPFARRRPLRVGSIGSIVSHKRLDVVVDAIVRLQEIHGIESTLDLWGPLVQKDTVEGLRARITEIGNETIALRGSFDPSERSKVLEDLDVLFVGSGVESFGFPMIEAMRTGTLVVAPDVPIAREACGDLGVFYRSGDPVDAADRLAAIASSDADPLPRLRAAVERSQRYSWSVCRDETLALLRSVASGDHAQ